MPERKKSSKSLFISKCTTIELLQSFGVALEVRYAYKNQSPKKSENECINVFLARVCKPRQSQGIQILKLKIKICG